MKRADYLFWMNVPMWTLRQFAFLLKGYEPTPLSEINDELVLDKMKRELDNWEAWGADCPGINDWDRLRQKPSVLSIEVNAKELVKWASTKKGVKIPKKLGPLLEKDSPKRKQDKPTDKRELVTYWQILAVLCKRSELNIDKPYEAAKIIQRWGGVHKVKLPAKPDTIAKKLEAVKGYLESQ